MKHQHQVDSKLRKKCFIFWFLPSFAVVLFPFPILEGKLNSSSVYHLPSPQELSLTTEALISDVNLSCPSGREDQLLVWCSCYEFDEGLFVNCPSTDLKSIRTTLNSISSPIKSFTIYHLEQNLTRFPVGFFLNSTIERLQISFTQLEDIPEGAFLGVETRLKTLSLANSKLKQVPQAALSVLKELQSLDLDSNDIAEVESYAFYGLPLVSLNLQGNKISSLLEYSFGGLENTLEELVLIKNKLDSFPLTALRRLRKLRTLKLLGNEIKGITDDGFTRFTALQNVDLNGNRIVNLNSRSFITMPKLVTLALSTNKLTTLDDKVFVHLVDLEVLDLSHNSLRTLNGDVFVSLHKLRTVDLSNNHLHYLKFGTFHNLPNLRELFLSRNNLLKISNDTFWNTTQISFVFLPHNAIREIEFGTFYNTPHLYQLHLSYNELREIHPSLFKYNHELRSLSLDNNLIANIHPGTFQELVELRDLRLQRNLLKKIGKGVFYSFPNLQELHLENNRIEMMENEALQSLANLEYLNIQGNRMIEIGDVLSKYPSTLRYLQLNNNNIFAIHNESFRGQNHLEILWLNYNKIQKITRDTFRDLIQVEKIYLDHNELSSIETDSFLTLKSLVYLNLEHNNLNHLTPGIFKGAVNLVHLHLSSNHIMDIEPFTFQAMRSLRALHLANNQIYVVRKFMFEGGLPIEELNLSNVMAEEIESQSFSDLSALQSLDISQNNLNTKRIEFIFPNQLKILNLRGNNLSGELDEDQFRKLSQIENLDASESGLNAKLSQKIFEQMPNIETLTLRANGMREFSNRVLNVSLLKKVKNLYLDGNKLEQVPDSDVLAEMSSLEVLSLASNSIKQVSKSSFRKNVYLKKINLSGNSLSVVEPLAFANLTALHHLDLSNNVIRYSASGAFADLELVEQINLDSNWFQYIPNNLIRSLLPKLKVLTLNRNPILRIREDLSVFGGFPRLEKLCLEQGNLSIIASHDFFGLPQLSLLSLRSNHISKISPGSFRPLQRLAFMDLAENELEILPEERLSGLQMLKTLNLTENHLLEMPSFSPDLGQLQHLDLSYNRLTRVDTFGHLGESVKSILLRNNIIAWIANNAFQNLSSLQLLDLRNNFVSHLGDAIFVPIEVTIETLLLSGNPFHCDCRLLDLWEWLQDHSRLLPGDERENELLCVQPEKLKDHVVLSLHPVDFCPVPLISLLEVLKLAYNSIRIRWDVQNDTLVGGFTLDYHLTSDHIPLVSNKHLSSPERHFDINHLEPETWYTICIQADGKFLRPFTNKPTPYVVDHQRNYGDYSSSNRKCLQVRTLAFSDKSQLPFSTISLIAGGSICVSLIVVIFVLATVIKIRRKRRRQRPVKNDVPEEYITYRHFSLPSSEAVYS